MCDAVTAVDEYFDYGVVDEDMHAGLRGQAFSEADLGFVAGLGDPSPEDSVAMGVELGLGGVVGAVSVVELAGAFDVEEQGLPVERTRLPDGLALSGVDEDVLVAEGEEVGAFPHLSG